MAILKNLIASTYPIRMSISKLTGIGISVQENKNMIKAPVSFYSLKAVVNNGEEIIFEKYRGKKVILVNLASQCGFTPQYDELEQLHQQDKSIVLLGFPSNNFGGQEPGSDQEIAQFCRVNYGVTFPLFKKDEVVGKDQQPIYQWLSDKNNNGWNDLAPKWNFYKYVVDENGTLSKIFSSSVAPLDMNLETPG
ncbi:MAG: glutathione peroxidase [Ginsengibacter sp.]